MFPFRCISVLIYPKNGIDPGQTVYKIIYRRFKKLVRQKTSYDYRVTGKMSCCQFQCLATFFTDVEKEFLKIAEKNPGLIIHVWSEFFMIRGSCDSYYYYDGKLQEKQMHGQEKSESPTDQSDNA